MKDISECRKELDDIDEQIARLFLQRMKVVGEVAEYKRGTGKAVLDRSREDEKRRAVASMSEDPIMKQSLTDLFTELMRLSREYQQTILR